MTRTIDRKHMEAIAAIRYLAEQGCASRLTNLRDLILEELDNMFCTTAHSPEAKQCARSAVSANG